MSDSPIDTPEIRAAKREAERAQAEYERLVHDIGSASTIYHEIDSDEFLSGFRRALRGTA